MSNPVGLQLLWNGKDKIINHHNEVPFKILRGVPRKSLQKNDRNSTDNIVIRGDNLEGLKALNPYFYNSVKLVFIDPPYNKGAKQGDGGWIYSDRVDSPEIKKWFNRVVGAEHEDYSRHTKWLCMMYPRLKLLHELLKDDGAIFITLDDKEIHHLRGILDEIFGAENFVTTIIWQKKFSPQNDAKYFSDMHDYIVVYAKNKPLWKRNLLLRGELENSRYTNPDNDPRGIWTSSDLTAKRMTPKDVYPIKAPSEKTYWPTKGRSWGVSKKEFARLVKDNRIWFGDKGNNMPRRKRFLSEVQEGKVPVTLWLREDVGDNQEAKREIKEIFYKEKEMPFSTPKPTRLLKRIIQISTDKKDIILDSFAGSGTTGHAALELNRDDGGRRRFILVQMDEGKKGEKVNICDTVTAERMRRVIKGYNFEGKDKKLVYERALDFKMLLDHAKMSGIINELQEKLDKANEEFDSVERKIEKNVIKIWGVNKIKEKKEGLGGSFKYYELNGTLKDEKGFINSLLSKEDLAKFIMFAETKESQTTLRKFNGDFKIGERNNVIFYFIHDKKVMLDNKFLDRIGYEKLMSEGRFVVVYAYSTLLDDEYLEENRENLRFMQIPNDLGKIAKI
ncbi:MAG: site-specific DNA-methyltransferase [Candidatus Omnitrophica bacterium]|nr:site-specific DNA-methyltransferase [Candidatus Omnitrophota bacterium]